MARLGDINHDGYNDIAVGAPFDSNGSVFVYLGGEKGLQNSASQRLNSPLKGDSPFGGTHMFGHGLSKGSDFDGNGFNDLAIGAPNAEAVFVYRAYPVVKVLATIHSQTREIKPEQTAFRVKVCYGFSTTSQKVSSLDLALKIVMDPQGKRVRIAENNNHELSMNVKATALEECRPLECNVQFNVADIFKPIELEVYYNVINGIPDSEG